MLWIKVAVLIFIAVGIIVLSGIIVGDVDKKDLLAVIVLVVLIVTVLLVLGKAFIACTGGYNKSKYKLFLYVTGGIFLVCTTDWKKEKQKEVYKSFFDIDNKLTIIIDISEEEIANIEKDFEKYDSMNIKFPIYRHADKVTITIGDKSYEIPDVGISMEGHTLTKGFYSEKKELCNRIYFKLKFNEIFDDKNCYGGKAVKLKRDKEIRKRKKRTFATLESFEVKWTNDADNASVRRLYHYNMLMFSKYNRLKLRKFGEVVQQNTFAEVEIAGENYGVFCVSEPVEK